MKTHYPKAKGNQWYCLPCTKASHRRRYHETAAAYDRARDPSKIRARKAVQHAVDAGRLTRCPCEVCGSTARVHAHHDDYSKPLDVMWLCVTHHRERHRYLDGIQASPERA